MCLTKLEKFEPCKVGYQVKWRYSPKAYSGMYNYVSNKMMPKVKYKAIRRKIGGGMFSYYGGFHVFHVLADAKRWRRETYGRSHANCVIVKVKTDGIKITGYQAVWGVRGRYNAKVTVCSEMTILHEVE